MKTKIKGCNRIADNEKYIMYHFHDAKGDKVLSLSIYEDGISLIPNKGRAILYSLSEDAKFKVEFRHID